MLKDQSASKKALVYLQLPVDEGWGRMMRGEGIRCVHLQLPVDEGCFSRGCVDVGGRGWCGCGGGGVGVKRGAGVCTKCVCNQCTA